MSRAPIAPWKKKLGQKMDVERRKKARENLAGLRRNVQSLAAQNVARTQKIRRLCERARKALERRIAERRRRFREEVQIEREVQRTTCGQALERAKATGRERLEVLRRAVGAARAEQRFESVYARKDPLSAQERRRALAERVAESDDEVERQLEDHALRPVWAAVKHKIRGSERRHRFEAFLEWVAEHPAQVQEILAKVTDDELAELERQEAAAFAERHAYSRPGLPKATRGGDHEPDEDDVPF